MAKRYFRNKAILVKPETTYGVDSVPTGALNAMQLTNVTLTPLAGQEVNRDLVVPNMGHQGVILVQSYATLQADIEIAGSGTAGTAPPCGPILRACALAEVVTAGDNVKYTPISTGQESVTIYINVDGVRHVLLGARGTLTLAMSPATIPKFTVTLTGLLGTITDVPLSAIDLTKFKKPVPVSKGNTTLSIFDLAGACESFNFDMANQIEPRFLIGSESIEHVDRLATGTVVMEAVLLVQKNWFQIAQSHSIGVISVAQGVTAGNIFQFDADGVQIGRPTYGDTQKIVNNSLPLMFTTGALNEFSFTFK